MKIVTAAASIVAFLGSGSAQAQQYPTIVGEWFPEKLGPKACGTPSSARITPMGFSDAENFSCAFNDVRRDGWQVTWNGRCEIEGDGALFRVRATEDDGKLSLTFNGTPGWSDYRRCAPAHAEAAAMSPPAPAVANKAGVTPEIASMCRDRWPTDFEMQAHCRDQQMNALREIQAQDDAAAGDYWIPAELAIDHAIEAYHEGGIEALEDYAAMCYDRVATVPFYLACVAVDYFGGLISETGYFAVEAIAARSSASAAKVGLSGTAQHGGELMAIAGARWKSEFH